MKKILLMLVLILSLSFVYASENNKHISNIGNFIAKKLCYAKQQKEHVIRVELYIDQMNSEQYEDFLEHNLNDETIFNGSYSNNIGSFHHISEWKNEKCYYKRESSETVESYIAGVEVEEELIDDRQVITFTRFPYQAIAQSN